MARLGRSLVALFVLTLGSGCGGPPSAPEAPPPPPPAPSAAPVAAEPTPANVDGARLVGADADRDNWLSHGRTYGEQRFSPLDQIKADNVASLGLAWSFDLDTNRGQEATPLVIDGVMYSTSAWSKVQALDAKTGKLLWQYDPKVPGETGAKACCDAVNRGVAAWKGRIYVGTLDGRLVALDAKTGKEVWSTLTVDPAQRYTITGAPRIVKGKVIIGNGGAEFGVRGYVSAYDVDTGQMVWRFYTVPGDPSKPYEAPILKEAAKTWTGTEYWKLGGGGTVWDSMAYDPDLDLLYIGVGNGSPWNQSVRSPEGGDNLFLSSIVALRPDTGEYVWHYQTTPGESWDYTATQHMVLADLTIDGKPRKVLMQAPKNGFFYVLDRETGKLLSAKPFATVNWASEIDLATGRPKENPAARYGKTGKPWGALPGPFGSHNWQPMSFSPLTGYVYIPVHDTPFSYVPDKSFKASDVTWNLGVVPADSLPPKQAAETVAMLRGYLKAWDPVAQKEVFRVELAGAWNGGVLSTAGGLVFQGDATGNFNAYSATDGKKLWSFQTQTGVIAAPMTYAVDGEQYVTLVAGWGGAYALAVGLENHETMAVNRSRVLTFKLGGRQKLPDMPPPEARMRKPPAPFGKPKLIPMGRALYQGLCSTCHGTEGIAGGVLPDLRWSPLLGDANAWSKVVLEGGLKRSGMPGFGKAIGPEQAELMRAFVTAVANQTYVEPKGDTPPAK